MRQISMIMLVAGVATLSACGGGTTSSGAGGAPSTTSSTSTASGRGGEGGTSTAAGTSSVTVTSTGVGGTGSTATATATATGSSGVGGGAQGALGAPCTSDGDCAGGLCLDEATQGWPKGYCSATCNLDAPSCPGTGVCVDDGSNSGSGVCLETCVEGANTCAAAYSCLDFFVGDVCFPTCTLDAQCGAFCDSDSGFCSATDEDCANGMDDDGDTHVDCEDLDCKATCGGQITAACALSTPALDTNMGDNSAGSSVFAGSCTGAGVHEATYSLTPGSVGQFGTLTATVSAAVDLGLYARLDCGDASTEIACTDLNPGRTDEVLTFEIAGGTPITLFVDGYAAGEEGPFTLTTSYQDNAPLCAAATAAGIGDNLGDTTTGTSSFTGSCTGAGSNEQIFTFTPAASGTLHLVLSSGADLGVYARSNCLDKTTELGCADLNLGGDDETLDVAVTSGVPVTVFVDGYEPTEFGSFSLTATLM